MSDKLQFINCGKLPKFESSVCVNRDSGVLGTVPDRVKRVKKVSICDEGAPLGQYFHDIVQQNLHITNTNWRGEGGTTFSRVVT